MDTLQAAIEDEIIQMFEDGWMLPNPVTFYLPPEIWLELAMDVDDASLTHDEDSCTVTINIDGRAIHFEPETFSPYKETIH